MSRKKPPSHSLLYVPTTVLVSLCLVSGVISVFALRNNNLTMVRLRQDVFRTDQDNGDTETALRNLREFVYSHMNTNLHAGISSEAPIQLVGRYSRLVEQEKARVSAVNANLQQVATATCEAQFPNKLSGGRLTCVQQYLANKGIRENPIPKELYTFDFVSPRFSFDLAGISLLLTIFFAVWLLGRLTLHLFLRSFMQS